MNRGPRHWDDGASGCRWSRGTNGTNNHVTMQCRAIKNDELDKEFPQTVAPPLFGSGASGYQEGLVNRQSEPLIQGGNASAPVRAPGSAHQKRDFQKGSCKIKKRSSPRQYGEIDTRAIGSERWNLVLTKLRHLGSIGPFSLDLHA